MSEEVVLFLVDNFKNYKIFQCMFELKNKLVVILVSGVFMDDEKFLFVLYGFLSFDNCVLLVVEEIIK